MRVGDAWLFSQWGRYFICRTRNLMATLRRFRFLDLFIRLLTAYAGPLDPSDGQFSNIYARGAHSLFATSLNSHTGIRFALFL